MRFSVDPWDPGYGTSMETVLDPSEVSVNAETEMAAESWCSITPSGVPADVVLFVDGVRRIDARVWVEVADGGVEPGICATYAAGVVRCGQTAELVASVVRRGVFSASRAIERIATHYDNVVYEPFGATDSTPEALWVALQDQMGRREVEMAEVAAVDAPDDALLAIDGPITSRAHVPGAVGVVKSHATAYLPPELHRLVGQLAPGNRTPVFTIGGRGNRHSWYLRLPGGDDAPWSGVVRCECSAELGAEASIALADRVSVTLPKYASRPHKDPRAPQNLYPVGGLERALRRRLGDPEILYRALRRSSFA